MSARSTAAGNLNAAWFRVIFLLRRSRSKSPALFYSRILTLELADMQERGSFLIYLCVTQSLSLSAGSLKNIFVPAGHYVYVGSARRGIAGRIARHRRLAGEKTGKHHWHVDYLLVHPQVEWAGEMALAGLCECEVSKRIASWRGVSVPVPHFGASDCRSGCRAHFYRIGLKSNCKLDTRFKFARRRENE